jgi:glycosyltransferase involved in cell wall biosynthesis
MFTNITQTISYGIDTKLFPVAEKKPYSFIYPSFPNRGLLQLLKIFPRITARYPEATLNIFCDTAHSFVQGFYKKEMDEIDRLLAEQPNVVNHGWVNGDTLRKCWSESQVWLYPCTYVETCCLTAYEAAASRTLVISNHLAALKDSIGNRGIIIDGDASMPEWHDKAYDAVCNVFDEKVDWKPLVESNYKWVTSEKDYSVVVPQFINRFIR